MGQTESGSERRRAMRVPVRGTVVLHGDVGPLHGTLENLSQSGALVHLAAAPDLGALELELRLVDGNGRVTARAVRVENSPHGARIAVVFDRVEPAMRASIDASIRSALTAARQRPILVIDDEHGRR